MKACILATLVLAIVSLSGATRTPRNIIIDNGSQTQIPYNPDVGPGTMASLSYDNPKMASEHDHPCF